ncbi:hypothetical protein ACOMHN_042781 [Nucella lapillus]
MMPLVALSLVVCVLCCGGVQAKGAPGYGHGPHYYPEDLKTLEDAANRVNNEALFLRERMAMAEMQKDDLAETQGALNDAILVGLSGNNSRNYARISSMKGQLKGLYHRVGAVEFRLAAVSAVGHQLKNRVPALRQQSNDLSHSNVKQDATLEEIETTLSQNKDKLSEELTASLEDRAYEIVSTHTDFAASAESLNTRVCFAHIAEIEIDSTTGQGTEVAPFPINQFPNGNVPTVLCGLQGTVSDRDLFHSKKNLRGYGQDVHREQLAVTVDCKAFEDKVVVKAFDQSASYSGRTGYNKVHYAYVEVRACTYSAQVGS